MWFVGLPAQGLKGFEERRKKQKKHMKKKERRGKHCSKKRKGLSKWGQGKSRDGGIPLKFLREIGRRKKKCGGKRKK